MLGLFLKIDNMNISCIVEFIPIICYLIEILLVVREWEREGLGMGGEWK